MEQVLPDLVGPFMRWFRAHWYDPRDVVTTGAKGLQRAWEENPSKSTDFPGDFERFRGLVLLAGEVLALYGADSTFLDYAALRAEVLREQALLAWVEATHHELQLDTVRPLYRQFHPSRNLETLFGVGQDGAAVYVSFIGDPKRFPSHADFRGWSGMIPRSSQTGVSEAKGLPISQAGPDLVKKFAFMGAETARRRDPQMVAIYYDPVVRHGKHHTQALCTCATHWLDRIWTILKEDRAHELRDVDGTPVTAEEARPIIAERYTVTRELRQRNNQRTRRERKERLAEKQWKRESGPRKVRGESETPSL